MDYPTSLPEAQSVIEDFVEAGELSNLSEHTQEKVRAALRELSMADRLVNFVEAIYGNAANVNVAARTAGAKIAGFVSGFTGYGPYHGLQVDDRGPRIVAALRRRNGHTSPSPDGWPAAATDPEAKPGTVPEAAPSPPTPA